MKGCIYRFDIDGNQDHVGCANTTDLIHGGTVPATICHQCPYHRARTLQGLGDLVARVIEQTGIARLWKRWRARCRCPHRRHWLNRVFPFRLWFPQAENVANPEKWAVVVTTAPRTQFTLPECVASLRANGWEPVIFAEPDSREVDCLTFTNDKRLGVWHNWLQSCRWALEHTDAELILTVQDDTVFHPECRSFIESVPWPSERCGFLSLYTPKHYGTGKSGLKRVQTRSLWGACALVWKREVLEQVINHRIARTWQGVPPRGRAAKSVMARRKADPSLAQNSDTAIGRIMNALKLEMWFVDPSPVRHVATVSSIKHGGNTGRRNCGICADPLRRLRDQVPQLRGL